MFDLNHLNRLRLAEIGLVVDYFPAGSRILEIGAGTGFQSLELDRRGFVVKAIDVAASNYTAGRIFPITDYDGEHIPFPDRSFDCVFTSNALEHVRELPGLLVEIKRVLKPGGLCIHILPTQWWRLWTVAAGYPEAVVFLWRAIAATGRRILTGRSGERPLRRAWIEALVHAKEAIWPPRHGELGSVVSEMWLFHPIRWRRLFRGFGFKVQDEPSRLFYTGHMLLGGRASVEARKRLAKFLGSACRIYRLTANP
jgi:SAM-dependent methyltransferase